METRFGSVHQTQIKLLCLVPCTSVTCTSSSIKDVGELDRSDLPSPQQNLVGGRLSGILFHQMIGLIVYRKLYYSCDKDAFPNIAVLLTIACTLPVTTCEPIASWSYWRLIFALPWERRGSLFWQTSRSIVEWSQILIWTDLFQSGRGQCKKFCARKKH